MHPAFKATMIQGFLFIWSWFFVWLSFFGESSIARKKTPINYQEGTNKVHFSKCTSYYTIHTGVTNVIYLGQYVVISQL